MLEENKVDIPTEQSSRDIWGSVAKYQAPSLNASTLPHESRAKYLDTETLVSWQKSQVSSGVFTQVHGLWIPVCVYIHSVSCRSPSACKAFQREWESEFLEKLLSAEVNPVLRVLHQCLLPLSASQLLQLLESKCKFKNKKKRWKQLIYSLI